MCDNILTSSYIKIIIVVVICSEVGEYRIMGCPKCIDDKKYERNAFIFNFVFVFSSSIDTSTYEPVIQKMGNAFRTYEVRSYMRKGSVGGGS